MAIVATGQITIVDVNDGYSGSALSIIATAQSFTFVDNVASPASQSIGFFALRQGVQSDVTWSATGNAVLTTNNGLATPLGFCFGLLDCGDGSESYLSLSAFGANDQVVVSALTEEYSASVSVLRNNKSTAAAGATVGAQVGNNLTDKNGNPIGSVVSDTTPISTTNQGTFVQSLRIGDGVNSNITIATKQLTLDAAGNAVFSGALQAATGTFAGSLAAGVLNASAFDSIKYEYATAGTYSLTIPAKKAEWTSMTMKLTVVGAGGGGGGARYRAGYYLSGSGGGAGTKNVVVIDNVTSGQVLSLVIGAGGIGGVLRPDAILSDAQGNINGTAGAASVVNNVTTSTNLVTSSGGGGGAQAAWDTQFIGGSLGGQNGDTGGYVHGGNGGSSGYGSVGIGGSGNTTTSAVGSAGTVGCGGGGGSANPGIYWPTWWQKVGGDGGAGYILVEFYDPNTIVLNSRYSALINWLDGIGHGSVPSGAR